MLKIYLVQVEQEEPFRLNLEEVFSIDNEQRALRREEVLWLTEERDPRLITLRIRQGIKMLFMYSLLPAARTLMYWCITSICRMRSQVQKFWVSAHDVFLVHILL